MGTPSRTEATDRPRRILRGLVIALGLAPVILAVLLAAQWYRATRPAPERDLGAEFAAIEAGALGVGTNTDAWAELLALDAELRAAMSEMARKTLDAYPDLKGDEAFIDFSTDEEIAAHRDEAIANLAYGRTLDEDHLDFYRANNDMVRRYAASDFPERLAEILSRPGIGPGKFGADAALSWGSALRYRWEDIAEIQSAERERLRLALYEDDAAGVAICARNLTALSDAMLPAPGRRAMFGASGGRDALLDATRECLHRGPIDSDVARALLPHFVAMHHRFRPETLHALRCNEILAQIDVAKVYTGEPEYAFAQPERPRLFWLSHAELARATTALHEQWIEMLEAGPVTGLEPAIEDELSADHELYTPLTSLNPLLDGAVYGAFWDETQAGAIAIMLAIEVYRSEHGSPPSLLDERVANCVLEDLPQNPLTPDGTYRYEPDTGTIFDYTLSGDFPSASPHDDTDGWPDGWTDVFHHREQVVFTQGPLGDER